MPANEHVAMRIAEAYGIMWLNPVSSGLNPGSCLKLSKESAEQQTRKKCIYWACLESPKLLTNLSVPW